MVQCLPSQSSSGPWSSSIPGPPPCFLGLSLWSPGPTWTTPHFVILHHRDRSVYPDRTSFSVSSSPVLPRKGCVDGSVVYLDRTRFTYEGDEVGQSGEVEHCLHEKGHLLSKVCFFHSDWGGSHWSEGPNEPWLPQRTLEPESQNFDLFRVRLTLLEQWDGMWYWWRWDLLTCIRGSTRLPLLEVL